MTKSEALRERQIGSVILGHCDCMANTETPHEADCWLYTELVAVLARARRDAAKEALEDAAKIAERGGEHEGQCIADEIRALAEPGKGERSSGQKDAKVVDSEPCR